MAIDGQPIKRAEHGEQVVLTTSIDRVRDMIAHELRTPLTAQKLVLQVLAKRLSAEGDQQTRALLDRALQMTRRMERLIHDLYDVAALDLGQLSMQCVPCDLIDMLNTTIEEISAIWPDRRIDLHDPLHRCIVLADADRVRQVITNLMTNAIKFSESPCPITVRVVRFAHCIRVLVRDQGVGLSPEEQQLIFAHPERVEGKGKGLGLGLFICQEIITRHGGKMGVTSRKNHGSTFWFELLLSDR